MSGLVAVGDSIINGHGDSMAGVPSWGWGQWLADAMGLSYTRYAKGGFTSSGIVAELLPLVVGTYDVGLFNMGTNDAYLGLDMGTFERNLDQVAEVMSSACSRVVVLTVPYSAEATWRVRAAAKRHDLIVVDGEVRGQRLLKADGIHPTALGQLEIAERAAHQLGAPSPRTLAKGGGDGSLSFGYSLGYATKLVRHRTRAAVKSVVKGHRLLGSPDNQAHEKASLA
jgi:lysophospholipase L1-like esterase